MKTDGVRYPEIVPKRKAVFNNVLAPSGSMICTQMQMMHAIIKVGCNRQDMNEALSIIYCLT